MQKAILISIRPEWVEKILNGEKTIEIRRNMPKCDLPIDVYIYCTKGDRKEYITITPNGGIIYANDGEIGSWGDNILNGKVVAKFTLNKVERFDVPYPAWFYEVKDKLQHITNGSCLNLMSLHHYLKNNSGYAWHIENLQIFDKPMELIQLKKYCDEPDSLKPCCNDRVCEFIEYDWCEQQCYCALGYDGTNCAYLKVNKPPRGWQYVYVED